jgi:hypothetical protein
MMGNSSPSSFSKSPSVGYTSDDDVYRHETKVKLVKKSIQNMADTSLSSLNRSQSISHNETSYTSDDDDYHQQKKIKLTKRNIQKMADSSLEKGEASETNSSDMLNMFSLDSDSESDTIRNLNTLNYTSSCTLSEKKRQLHKSASSEETVVNKRKSNKSNLNYYEDDELDESDESDENDESDEDYKTDIDDETEVDSINYKKDLYNYIKLADMTKFTQLKPFLAGLKEFNSATIKTLYGRVASFLGYVMSESNNENNNENSIHGLTTQEKAIILLMEEDMKVLERYVQVLRINHGKKVGTCYNVVLDIRHWLQYMTIHEKKNIPSVMEYYRNVLCKLMKQKRKDQKRRLSREQLQTENKFPAGGKAELINIFEKKASRVNNILHNLRNELTVTEKNKIFAYYWIVTHIFIHNPQARVKAITEMSINDIEKLRKEEYLTSTEFKTADTYGSQVIPCNKITFYYIEAYVVLLRPWLNMKNNDSDSTDKLFLSLSGRPFSNVGICVTRLFSAISKYHITTNSLRTIFETDVSDAAINGVITDAQRDYVARHNNHSSITAWHHYQKRKAVEAAQTTTGVHIAMYGEPSSQIKPLNLAAYDETYAPSMSGDEEQDVRKPVRVRSDWTDEELMHLRNWVEHYEQKYGNLKKNWMKCLIVMRKFGCFQECHLTTEKLREAYKRLKSNSTKFTRTSPVLGYV